MKDKFNERLKNHMSSSKYKARGKMHHIPPSVMTGDIVYINGDCDKTRARDGYLVTAVENDKCILQKLTGTQFRKKKFTVSLHDVYKPEVINKELSSESADDLQQSHMGSDESMIDNSQPEADHPPPPTMEPARRLTKTYVPTRSTRSRRNINPPRHLQDFVMGTWQ